jgi:hypothetical protein
MIKKRAILRATPSLLALAPLAALLLAAPLAAQEGGAPAALPEDPPKAFFSTQLGDDEVELLIQGLWEASLSSSASYSFGPASLFNPVPLLFQQRPDLYLLLTFKERWWFEASVADEAERSTFALGFTGGEGDAIKSARLGNVGIAMPDYPYMAFGSPKGAFGAVLSAEANGASFDALVRWDGLSWRSKSFFGLGETVETELRPENHLRGRRFALPHATIEDLRLYELVEGVARLLSVDEYSASLAQGLVLLNQEPRGSLYAYYLVGGSAPVAPAPDSTIPVVGLSAFKLYEKGGPATAYEARNIYALADSSDARELFVRSVATGQAVTDYVLTQLAPGLIEVTDTPPFAAPFHDDPGFLTPFIDNAPWVYDEAPPSGENPPYPADAGFAVVARSFIALDSLGIETAAVAGTISISRDGVPSLDFDYDASSGALTLYPPPRAGESIVVRYAVDSQDRSDGGLVFGAGARFPWLGLDWAVALGGRWSLPGQGYAEGGELKPAWAGLSAETRYEGENARAKADAFLRYSRASASGLYRLAGMEDGGPAMSPFRLTAVTASTGGFSDFEIVAFRDNGLTAAFPEELAGLHGQNEDNYALRVTAGPGSATVIDATIELVRYVEPAPLSSFSEFSFFVKSSTAGGATLSLYVDRGDNGAGDPGDEGLALEAIALDGLADWTKISLRLDPARPTLTRTDANGTVTQLIDGSYLPSAAPSRVFIEITGLDDGEVVWIDELIMREADEGLALLGSASFSMGDERAEKPLFVSIESRGQVSGSGGEAESLEASIAGSLAAGFSIGPSQWRLGLSPSYADGQGALGAGYSLYLPSRGAPTGLYDEYSRDAVLGRYARSLGGALSLGAFSLGLGLGSQEEAGRFSQAWTADASVSDYVRLKGGAALRSASAQLGDLNIADAWLASWGLALPAAESQALSRSLTASGAFLNGLLALDTKHEYAHPNDPGEQASSSVGARLGYGFKLGSVDLSPYYERATSASAASASASFAEDAGELGGFFGRSGTLWAGIPLAELFLAAPAAAWEGAFAGSLSASHANTLGIKASRPIGFGLVDFWLPSAAGLSYTRSFELAQDLRSEKRGLALELRGGSANLFGRNGIKPLLKGVEFDEYSSSIDLSVSSYASDPDLLPVLSLRHSLAFEGGSGWQLNATNRFFWEQGRSALRWSEGVSLALSTRPASNWFGRLVRVVLPLEREAGDTEDEPGSVAYWLKDVFRRSPTLRESWNLELKLARADELLAPLVLSAAGSYETRLIQAGSLSLGFKLGLEQSVSVNDTEALWGGSYEITLDAKVIF